MASIMEYSSHRLCLMEFGLAYHTVICPMEFGMAYHTVLCPMEFSLLSCGGLCCMLPRGAPASEGGTAVQASRHAGMDVKCTRHSS